MSNIRHSSNQPRWGTAPEVTAIAQLVLGAARLAVDPTFDHAITVDPFSEAEYNEHVRAVSFLTGEPGRDGFKDRWIRTEGCPRADQLLAGYPAIPAPQCERDARHTALVNPPGDDTGTNIKNAWLLLDSYRNLHWIDSAVWVAFNLNQMQTLQQVSEHHPLSDAFIGCRCVPSRRLDFVRHSSMPTAKVDKKTGKEVEVSDAPSHPCFFLLLPSHDEVIASEQLRLFESYAAELGAVF